MSDTATASKRSSGQPFEEPIMVRYSPHHEFPLSTVTSVGLHALVIGLLVIGGLVIARLSWGSDQLPVMADTVTMEPGGGNNADGAGQPAGDDFPARSDIANAALRGPDDQFEAGRPREKLKEVREKAPQLPEYINDEEGKRLIKEGGEAVDRILGLRSDERQRLNAGLARKGPGNGNGEDGNGGPGGGAAERSRRVLRWTLVFNTRDGNDYRKQLKAFGAILAIPDPKDSDKYLVIRDLDRPAPKAEDIAQIKRIYWIDDGAASVRSLSAALRLPAPPHFVVFFPAEFEEKLLKLELSYRGKKENEISETRFDVRRSGDTYEPAVISQR